VVDKDVWELHCAHDEAGIEEPLADEIIQHMAAKAANGALLNGEEHIVIAGEPQY